MLKSNKGDSPIFGPTPTIGNQCFASVPGRCPVASQKLGQSPPRRFRCTILCVIFACWQASWTTAAEHSAAYDAALASISAGELAQNVHFLADKGLEGREAGSRGGYAAGDYLAGQFAKLHLAPGGTDRYFQTFSPNFRNVLAIMPGSDPALKNQFVVVGAHYDHLGHGFRSASANSGQIHPGADDNASGTSAILQLAKALSLAGPASRSVLLAAWDAEEKGLLGSRHWLRAPTVPLPQVAVAVNVDMIGSLRDNRLYIWGSRTGYGLRRFVSEENREAKLLLDFSWPMKANADHYPFYERGIPVLMLHTGLHDRWHRPTDDAEHVNPDGMMRAVRLLLPIVYDLANRPASPRFRGAAGSDDDDARKRLVAPEPSVEQPGDPPLRLGIAWRVDEAEPGTIVVIQVAAGSPAAKAGLKVGDRVYRVAGRDFPDDTAFAKLATTLPGPLELLIERDGQFRVVVLHLAGEARVKRAA
jgi:hypothetical protein